MLLRQVNFSKRNVLLRSFFVAAALVSISFFSSIQVCAHSKDSGSIADENLFSNCLDMMDSKFLFFDSGLGREICGKLIEAGLKKEKLKSEDFGSCLDFSRWPSALALIDWKKAQHEKVLSIFDEQDQKLDFEQYKIKKSNWIAQQARRELNDLCDKDKRKMGYLDAIERSRFCFPNMEDTEKQEKLAAEKEWEKYLAEISSRKALLRNSLNSELYLLSQFLIAYSMRGPKVRVQFTGFILMLNPFLEKEILACLK